MPIPPEKFFVLGGGSNVLLIGHIPLTFLRQILTVLAIGRREMMFLSPPVLGSTGTT